MRSYMIEELSPEALQRAAKRFKDLEMDGVLEGVYWLAIPETLLTEEQQSHGPDCGPHCVAIEVDETWIKMELLVRCRQVMRCSCIAYCTPPQRAFVMDWLDDTLKSLDISV